MATLEIKICDVKLSGYLPFRFPCHGRRLLFFRLTNRLEAYRIQIFMETKVTVPFHLLPTLYLLASGIHLRVVFDQGC
jgi:hypothetical protein